MKWFRSNIRLGSRLALLALAIQFLLSFGHFHEGSAQAASASMDAKRSGPHHGLAVAQLGAPDRASQAKTLKFLSPVRSKTSDHVPLGHPCDDCAVCAVMALANTVVDAAPPLLLSPHATAFSYLAADDWFAEPHSARVAFQPRGPPMA
ncbi:MAG: DUF2946 domain-containing protein [Xanthobacteraceae bacterium]